MGGSISNFSFGGHVKLYRVLFVVAITISSILFFSCASSSGTSSIKDKSFNPDGASIALFPPQYSFGNEGQSLEAGSELMIGEMVYTILEQRTSSIWMSPDETVTFIQDAELIDVYVKLIEGYQKSGIISKTRLKKLTDAVGTPYIAVCEVSHRVSGVTGMSGYRSTSITLQVLSSANGKVVLELLGNAQCGSGGYDVGAGELMKMSIDKAVDHYPGAKPSSN